MSLTKAHNRMIAGAPASVLDFGAIGDGVADDSSAVQAAIDANDFVYFPAGEYRIKSIKIDGSHKGIYAPQGSYLRHDFADSTNMFDVAETTKADYWSIDIARARIDLGGGHFIRCHGDCNHADINVNFIDQNATNKSIIYVNDTGFYFNKINGLNWQITTSHTVPAIYLRSTSNKITANEFNIVRPDRSGSRHFMELTSTSSSDFNYSNVINLSNPEVCNGGVLKISRTMNAVIGRMHCFDTNTTTNNMIEVGASGYVSQNTKIKDYQRNSGTLGSGLYDIKLVDSNYTYIENVSGTSASTLAAVDLNIQPNSVIVGGGFHTIINEAPSTTVTITSAEGVASPKLSLMRQAGTLTIASGAITVTDSVHRIDTEGAAATDDLVTINGGSDGYILILRTVSSSRDVTLKDTGGNLLLAGDFVLDNYADTITLRYDDITSSWIELTRSSNA